MPFVFVQAEGVVPLWSGTVIIYQHPEQNAMRWLVEQVGWSSELAGRASWLVEHWRRAATLYKDCCMYRFTVWGKATGKGVMA